MLQEKEFTLRNNRVSYLLNPGRENSYTVIFIHGFPFQKEMWRNQLLNLPSDFTGIAYDIRGFGGSSTDHCFFSIDLFATDLISLIESQNLKNIILCGLSMGGYIALRTIEKSPDRFKALILSDTNSSSDANESKLTRFQSISKIIDGGKQAFADDFVQKALSETTLQTKPETVAFTKNMILALSDNTLCATQLALASRTDTTSFLPEINVPALVIRGADDQLMKPEQAAGLTSGIEDCEYAEIPDTGHLPNLENPEAFNNVVNSFLRKRFQS